MKNKKQLHRLCVLHSKQTKFISEIQNTKNYLLIAMHEVNCRCRSQQLHPWEEGEARTSNCSSPRNWQLWCLPALL
jgi:hypothetical protein